MNDPRDITHNLRTAIVDADGKLVKVYTGNEWTPEQVLADLKTACAAELGRRRLGDQPDCRGVHAARAAADRAAADAARGAALPERAALQPGAAAAARRCAAFAASSATAARTASRRRCSPPSSSSSTAIRRCVLSFESIDELDHVIFVYRQQRPLGIDRALARSRACTAASRCSPRRARWRSATSIRTSTSPAASPATPSSISRGDGRLRLAAGGHERLEGRADAARLSAPPHRVVGRARRTAARAVSRVPSGASRTEAAVLRGPRAVDARCRDGIR